MSRLDPSTRFTLLVLTSMACLSAARRPKLLDDLLTVSNVVPGHINSVERIPGELHVNDVEPLVLSEAKPADNSLFGIPYNFKGSGNDLTPGVHPRIVVNKKEWDTLIENYASGYDLKGTWAHEFLKYTLYKGPRQKNLTYLAKLDTSAYTGDMKTMDKGKLKELAKETLWMGEYYSGGMFMSALHAFVNEKYADIRDDKKGYLNKDEGFDRAINIIVNYAKVLLSHHAVYACKECEYKYGMKYSDLWNSLRGWNVNNDWTTAGIGIAMAYDVLYDRMTMDQQMFVNSAIGIMVKERQHWGITDFSNKFSPNAQIHPHRIFSNWATYHANLYLTNLAIEGEYNFDNYALAQNVSYNEKITIRTISLFQAFVDHSINPEGSTFEDGYMYSLAFREGSLAFVALARRGYNHLNTTKFRNFIYNGAQMHEPFRCGHFIGHSSGGGALYPASYALFRYAYPHSSLANMMWAQRMGLLFKNFEPCRIWWHQVNIQVAILGGEHMLVDYESPSGLEEEHKKHFAKSAYFPRRGLLVARSDYSDKALYFHFDGRPDAWILGHDNADRGVITFSSHGRTWLDDYPWRHFPSSQVHSIMHIDGQAQALKAPGVRMLKVKDSGDIVISAADLTYAYNVQWARAWSSQWEPFHWEVEYIDGKPKQRQVVYKEKEQGSPTDFGWPKGDNTSDLGIQSSTKIWGDPDLGFAGTYIWKRNYRQINLKYGVRSTALVRGKNDEQYVFLGDNFAMTGNQLHKFEQYFIFAPGVSLQRKSRCKQPPCACLNNPCVVYLTGGDSAKLELHVSTLGNDMTYNTTEILITKRYKSWGMRLVVTSAGMNSERFCTVLFPHNGTKSDTLLLDRSYDTCKVRVGKDVRGFKFNEIDRTIEAQVLSTSEMTAFPSPSTTSSFFPLLAASPSASPTWPTSPYLTPSQTASQPTSFNKERTPSPTASPSVYPSHKASPSASVSSGMTPTATGTILMIPSRTSSPSATASSSMTLSVPSSDLYNTSATSSATPTASTSPFPKEEDFGEFFPMDPLPLPDETTFSISESEISMDKPHFFVTSKRDKSYSKKVDFTHPGQVVFDILAFEKNLMRITTCLPGTASITRITIWDCGAFGEDGEEAYNNYYNRMNCHEVPNLRETESENCANKDVFDFIPDENKFKDGQFAIYFVVVSVEKTGTSESATKMKFSIKYFSVNGPSAGGPEKIGDGQYDFNDEYYDGYYDD